MEESKRNTNPAYAYLGFATKAGKLKSGAFAAEKAIESGRAALVVLDTAASENTRRDWNNKCDAKKIAFLQMPDIGRAIGKPERIVAAVIDADFAAIIAKANNEYNDGQRSN